MAGPFGYGSAKDYADAIEREAIKMTGQERRYPQERSEPQQRARLPQTNGPVSGPFRGEGDYDLDGFKLAGKPGSPERLQQLRERYPEMYPEVNKELEAANLSKLLTAYMDNPGHHEQVALQTARMIVDIDDPGILDQVREVLDGTPVLERVEDHVATAVQAQIDRHEQATQEEQQAALDARQQKLQSEFDRLPAEDAELILNTFAPEDLYRMEENEAVLHMRTAAEYNAARREGLKEFALVAPIVEEMKRYGPGGASDEEREKWERELEADTMEKFDRHMIDPEQAVERAADSMIREHTPPPFTQAFNEELDKLSKTEEQIEAEVELARRVRESPSDGDRLPHRTSATEWETKEWET
jgi:molybdopterin converting factor small subunit